MMTKKTFVRGNDRIKRLAVRPDLVEGVSRTRREMADADIGYAEGLAVIRRAAHLTQDDIAKKLGVTQARVSQIEQPNDMLLSTLSGYLEAAGAHGTFVVRFENGPEVQLDLQTLRTGSRPEG
jgi:hypothetical protein